MNRHTHHAATLFTSALVALLTIGCASPRYDRHSTNDATWDVYDQVQHSAALVGLRYAAILKDLHEGYPDKAQESTDWWLDQTILLLATLEKEHPERNWADRTVSGDDELPIRRLYRDIAAKRLQVPRSHNVPFEPDEIHLINDFVDRYK